MNTPQQNDHQYLWHPFEPMKLWLEREPLVIERGEGIYLYDTNGNRYIDAVSSLWCNVHGHNHPHINAAICEQLDKIAHSTMLGLSSPPAIELARRLAEITPGDLKRTFYSDSGATAVEIAIKIAFQHWRNRGNQKKTKFIALEQAYHGDTMGSVSVGGIELFHRIFGPMTFEALFAEAPDPYRFDGTAEQCRDHCLENMEQLLKKQHENVAAIVVEPLVQGASGIIVQPKGYLKGIQNLARKYDVLLITDEVATGFGRTGKMFACEHEKVTPDILCCAKGLTGGYLPLAATITTEKVFEPFLNDPILTTTFYHGHTYTGNPLACAAALASLELFDTEKTLESLPPKIDLIAERFKQIEKLPYVGHTRQMGLMCGIELVEDKQTKAPFDAARRIGTNLCYKMRSRGVLCRPLGNVMVLMPPLSISLAQLGELLDIIEISIKTDLPDLLDLQ